MEIDDRESSYSGSLSGNPESESPPLSGGGDFGDHGAVASGGGGGAAPGLINVNLSVDHAATAAQGSPAPETRGGVIGGGVENFMSGGTATGPGGSNGVLSLGKKKRGRPRKYDADGNLNPAYIKSSLAAAAAPLAGFTLSTPPSYEHSGGKKRGRGKHHSGPTNWPVLASLGELFANTAGGDFTPHVVTVHTGEDVAGKILTFAQKDHRGICVLSANGSVSNVTLLQPGSSGGLLTYEGRFEILTLTGSYAISDNGGMRSRCGGLSVSLASPDGRVIGGGVAGLLMAASPTQIVVGTFIPNCFKTHKRKNPTEPKGHPACAPATFTAATPISQAPPEAVTHPPHHSHFLVGPQNPGQAENASGHKGFLNSAPTETAEWNGPGPGCAQRPSPDINISIPIDEH